MWYFFFFKKKTAYEMRISDWSSDVCSSDLPPLRILHQRLEAAGQHQQPVAHQRDGDRIDHAALEQAQILAACAHRAVDFRHHEFGRELWILRPAEPELLPSPDPEAVARHAEPKSAVQGKSVYDRVKLRARR